MANVYYTKINNQTTAKQIQKITRRLLSRIIEEENIKLLSEIPLKVHFGEKGNVTFIKSENYQGIIDFLRARKIKTCFIETNVLYAGQRHKKKLHLKLAKEHGFTQLPIIIADGEYGEDFEEVEVNKKHFKTCKIGRAFGDYQQMIVLSHFKGHKMAGFGGAIKQLSMGCASRGGKLAMHMGEKPQINQKKCVKCHLCETRCNENAITINEKESFIDQNKCVGCGACTAVCPHNAISIMSVKGVAKAFGLGHNFKECLVEYAYAASKDKKNIYLNFVMNITKGCDCEARSMKPLMDDIGIFISTDPVSIDQACFNVVKKRGKMFKGKSQLVYAQKIGLGERKYRLVWLSL
ncbi:MAG: DUF362 domain-containing protein [Candidatus Moranbacteria bacterium]|nr:DUF362 domain-containing protein [Candidatus Moranbacteria bacterium]